MFERAASPRELGFGLLLAPNAFVALRDLGVADTVLSRGWEPTRGELRRVDGTVLKRAELPPRVLGGPLVVALRQALHGSLLEAVGIETISLASEVSGFRRSGSAVVLELASGQTVEGDLLIGADGMHSVIRRQLHPAEPPPRSSGIVAVRGGVHGAIRHIEPNSGIYYLGPGIEAFLVRASETGIYWALSLAQELIPGVMREPGAILAHLLPGMDPVFRAVAAQTEDLRCDELFDRDPLTTWGDGPVTLLGDAAHPVLPHTGQGAAQAMTDAVALGRALTADGSLEQALRAYELDRQRKTAALLAQGRRTARVMRSTSPLLDAARGVALRLMPITTFLKLFARINHRAGTDVTA